MSASQVYLIDDKPESRTSLAFLLQGRGMGVHAFSSIPDFLQWLDYDSLPKKVCVVTEFDMPEMNALDLCNVFEADQVELPIVFISSNKPARATQPFQEKGIPLLQKPFPAEKLIDTVIAAIATQTIKVNGKGYQAINDDTLKSNIQRRIASLSAREQEVLAFVFDGLLNKLIADRLNISIKTVEMHRAHMMKKMQAKSIIDLIKMIATNGGVPQLHS